jgi:outer membrane protein insertion porin family
MVSNRKGFPIGMGRHNSNVYRATTWFRIFLASLFFLCPRGTALGQEESAQIQVVPAASATVISKIHVDIVDAVDNRDYWIGLARSVIFLKEGEPFSEEKLRTSIAALELCEQFREIHVDSGGDTGSMDLFFRLKLNAFIKDIRIKSVYPFFKRELLNAMTIYPGDVYSPGTLTKQLGLLTTFVEKRGYFSPGVYINAEEDAKDGNYIVHVEIVKGPYFSLDHIEIKGNRAFSDTRLKMKFSCFRRSVLPGFSSRLIEKEVKKEIEGLKRFYWRKGFPDAEIRHTIEKDIERKVFSILMTIDEGPEYKVDFTGNHGFWFRDFFLAKELVLFTHGNKNKLGIRKSLRNITARYRKAGYLEARVRVEEAPEKERTEHIKHLRFAISEGPRSIVESIRIKGNHKINTKKIEKQILTDVPRVFRKGSYVPDVLEEDIAAIYTVYAKEGFQNARIEENAQLSEDGKKVTVHIDIHEGGQTLISEVTFKNLTAITEKEAYDEIRLKQGKPYQPYLVRADENRLSALISEKGYPHIKVKGVVLENDDKTDARIEYRVDEGVRV